MGRFSVFAGPIATCVLVMGCAAAKQDAVSLLPPAVIAGGTLQSEADKANCLIAASKVDGKSSLDVAPGARPCKGPNPSIETGTLQAVPPAAGSDHKAVAAVEQPAGAEELYIDFLPTSASLSEAEKVSVRESVAAHLLAGATQVRIAAGRGGTGNLFDQAIFAEKRARFVKGILPNRIVSSIEFDPGLPDDTVRLEFVRAPKSPN